ncbi:MAG TPA: beta-N-acetylhexosaminidase [Burkholderiales bacterium]|nr:beta-N-acetylhexosaminidase [Burkholderiales bacterium]
MSAGVGPAVIDLEGPALLPAERGRLLHPAAGGVILFSRNYRDPAQLRALAGEIRDLRPDLLLCVDQEGGRVQRFREGFTALPPMRRLGELWDRDPQAACASARAAGLVIATELAAQGIDFSFAPVLDLDYGGSAVIGDRAFHADPDAVGRLAAAFIGGLAEAGVAAVGKHFPGHGYVRADSHVDLPRDDRPLADILARDVSPYRAAIAAGMAAVMPAHVVYTQADAQPAGYSAYWLREVLRGQLEFDGLIFSDDLSMRGATGAGGVAERARLALKAGCDMVLLCNDALGQDALLESLADAPAVPAARVARMRARDKRPGLELAYRDARDLVRRIA